MAKHSMMKKETVSFRLPWWKIFKIKDICEEEAVDRTELFDKAVTKACKLKKPTLKELDAMAVKYAEENG